MEKREINNTHVGADLVSAQNHREIKNDHAVTIMALVITTIVLLILAGVVLNLSLGENGIIKNAELAKQQYENKAKEEENVLAQAEQYMINNQEKTFLSGEKVHFFSREMSTYNVKTATWVEVFRYVADKSQYFFASVTNENYSATSSEQIEIIYRNGKVVAEDGSPMKSWSRSNASACGELEKNDVIQIVIWSQNVSNPNIAYNVLFIDK